MKAKTKLIIRRRMGQGGEWFWFMVVGVGLVPVGGVQRYPGPADAMRIIRKVFYPPRKSAE